MKIIYLHSTIGLLALFPHRASMNMGRELHTFQIEHGSVTSENAEETAKKNSVDTGTWKTS